MTEAGGVRETNLPIGLFSLMAKKNGKKRPQISNRTNFPRRRRLPNRVQASSELWLDMFLRNIDTLLSTRDMDSTLNEELTITMAESLADRALHCFEIRWPNAEI